MRTRITRLILLALFFATGMVALGGDTDSEIKQKLLGYWGNPRHSYLFQSDGVIYMCPRSICTTTNRWDVKSGVFYWDSDPHQIMVLTDKKFVFRSVGPQQTTFT